MFSLKENDNEEGIEPATLYFGVLMGLVGACARSASYVACSILYRDTACYTQLILLYSGLVGLVTSLVSASIDSDNLILSPSIISLSLSTWLGLLSVAMLGVTAIFMLNKAIALSNPNHWNLI